MNEVWEEATRLNTAKKYDEAEKLYDLLLTQNPDNAGLMATIGTLYLQTRRIGLAVHFLEAASKTLKQSDVLSNLGLAYKYAGLKEKSMKAFEDSIRVEPSGETLANYSALLLESGQEEKCRKICKRAIDLSPEHPIAHWNMSLSLLSDGIWERGWDEREWGLVNSVMRVDRTIGGVPVWNGQPGKVAVYGEEGMGDEIMYASMIPDLMKTNTVVIESHPRLKTLFEKSFGVEVHGAREDEMPMWVDGQDFEYRLAIGSLGKFYRRTKESFPGTPYLKAEALPKGRKFRVGISWVGGTGKQSRIEKRSVPLPWWSPILAVPDIEFVSLQYTDCAEELRVVNGMGHDIQVMDEYVKADDYYETARLVASCDLVISVCTSVIHLAGALGVPCWVMTPKFPAWRYQNQGRMPWYGSVRLYRQMQVGEWHPLISAISSDLRDLVHQKHLKIA